MSKEKILVIDEDAAMNKLVCSYLAKEQFITLSAFSAAEAMILLKEENPDLIILESILPDKDGTELSLDIKRFSNSPIVFLSTKTKEIDKIIAFSAGGDDYVTKPFMPGEFIARIKAHLRRQNSLRAEKNDLSSNVIELDNLKIDFDTHECIVESDEIKLTSKEFEILRLLIENPRKVFPAEQIYEAVWKTACMENDPKTVMVYISTLRKKLEPNDNSPNYIVSVRGVGYKFNQGLLQIK